MKNTCADFLASALATLGAQTSFGQGQAIPLGAANENGVRYELMRALSLAPPRL